jgi:hypothetical protein
LEGNARPLGDENSAIWIPIQPALRAKLDATLIERAAF